MTGRNFLITLNNPIEDPKTWLERAFSELQLAYVVGQLEKGKEGTPHIQAFLNFKKPVRPSQLKKFDKKMHIELVKINNGAHTYCMKEDTRLDGPWEFGVKPVQRNNKTDWEDVWKKATQGKLEDLPKDILIKHYGNLKKIEKDHLKFSDKSGCRGVWVWGPSGAGKSRWAREQFPDFYPKLCNKWWDGYQQQRLVIMDDIGLEHKCLGQQLKIWGDRYGFVMETKGGAISDNYQYFIVTSQYSIEQIFHEDLQTIEALKRRYQEVNIKDINGLKLSISTPH